MPPQTTTPPVRNLMTRAPLRRAFLLIPLVLGCFGLWPTVRALTEGDLGNANTAEGAGALAGITTGTNNTALGAGALNSTTTTSWNTATGAQALKNNTGRNNTADGFQALISNTTGNSNTANGEAALARNTTGQNNTANGFEALAFNTAGNDNTGEGFHALLNSTGNNNIAIGSNAGSNLTTGDNNIDIAALGAAGEAATVRIGTVGTHIKAFIAGISVSAITGTAVVINNNGRLGVASSSQRFKDQIKPMDKASEAILALKPVTFRYKPEIDPEGTSQFGLVAEQVEKINPALVTRDAEGKIFTVRYEAVNAMLLNEFLKQHCRVKEQERKIQEQEATITQLRSTDAKQEVTITQLKSTDTLQQQEIQALTASLRKQASLIQKVSEQLELSKPAPQIAANDQ